MKKFLTFVFLAFFGVMAYAQDAEISFKAEEIDYGNIKQVLMACVCSNLLTLVKHRS